MDDDYELKKLLTAEMGGLILHEDTNHIHFWWSEGEFRKQKPVTEREWVWVVCQLEHRLTSEELPQYVAILGECAHTGTGSMEGLQSNTWQDRAKAYVRTKACTLEKAKAEKSDLEVFQLKFMSAPTVQVRRSGYPSLIVTGSPGQLADWSHVTDLHGSPSTGYRACCRFQYKDILAVEWTKVGNPPGILTVFLKE